MYRVTGTENSDISDGKSTYVTYLALDRLYYQSGAWNRTDEWKQGYEHEMVLNEDLKIPSREQVKKTVQEVVRKNPTLVEESTKGWINNRIPEGSIYYYQSFWDDSIKGVNKKWVEDYIKKTVNSMKDKTLDEAFLIHMSGLGSSPKTKEAIINSLKKQGYNAMVDESGVGVNIKEGIDPLIIFDSKSLTNIRSDKISDYTQYGAYDAYTSWTNRARRKNESW